MEMRLHGSERSSGLACDLIEAQLPEEPQRDGFAIRLRETRHGSPDRRRALVRNESSIGSLADAASIEAALIAAPPAPDSPLMSSHATFLRRPA